MRIPPYKARRTANLFRKGEYPTIVGEAVEWLDKFEKLVLIKLSNNEKQVINRFVEHFLNYIIQPEFQFSIKDMRKLLRRHTVLTNLLAISEFGNSDEWLRKIIKNRGQLHIAMVLANSRSTVPVDRHRFFARHPALASMWYGLYFMDAPGFVDPVVYDNLNEHLLFWDDKMKLGRAVSNGYMRCTYFNPEQDRVYKSRFNELVKREYRNIKINNSPDKNEIAVVTGRWSLRNPTYKNRYPLFEHLSKFYNLTLVHVGNMREDIETDIFREVKELGFKDKDLDLAALQDNRFMVVFYPDIGMSRESRFLCNLRFAPIQITTNSHPVSTFGSEIDYFLTGADSEQAGLDAADHYSERLVLIPGIGTYPVKPPYEPKQIPAQVDPMIIGCSWGSLKFNYPMVDTLRKIRERLTRNTRFRFLSTLEPAFGNYIPFRKDLVKVLQTKQLELYANMPYAEYMELFESVTFSLDPFPFGGNTSIFDALYLKKPVVVWEGWQFYNKAGAVILRKLDLAELVAQNEEEYIDIAVRLVEDAGFREGVQKKLATLDISRHLDGFTDKHAFKDAIDYLVKNHDSLKHDTSREPLSFD